MILKALLVDDEPLAIDVLKSHLEKLPQVEVVASCQSAIEANEILKEKEINLLFLDINLPQISGLEFIRTLSDPPHIILTTAHSEYAVEGFDLNVVDYLLKPISFDRLLKAVNRIFERQKNIGPKGEGHIYVKADKKLVRVDYQDILYIEGLKDYVLIKTADSRIVTLQTMKSLEKKLPPDLFRRVHRSYIANTDHIEAIDGNTVYIGEGKHKKSIPIGKNYKDEILEFINQKRL